MKVSADYRMLALDALRGKMENCCFDMVLPPVRSVLPL